MLVLPETEVACRLVLQPEHAAHAHRLAEHWRRPDWASPAVWPRFLEAVRRHDDGWRAAERRPAVDRDGRPVHFTDLDADEHLRLLLAGIDQVAADDLYAGLLTALHFRYLETHIPDTDPLDTPLVQRFLTKVDDRVDGALRMLKKANPAMRAMIEPQRLEHSRLLLSTLDALSLRLLGGLPWQTTTVCLPCGDTTLDVHIEGDGHTATLDPWPFEGGAFTVTATVLCAPLRRYATRAEFAEALSNAETTELATHVRPASSGGVG